MFWSKRKKKPTVPETEFGFGQPFHVLYDKRQMPDPGAPAVAYLTEYLPLVQIAGPSFQNLVQKQTIRHPAEMMVALPSLGLTTIGAPGVPAGYFALQPLTDPISKASDNLPAIANPTLGEYQIPSAGLP